MGSAWVVGSSDWLYKDPQSQAMAYDLKIGVLVMVYILQNADSVKDNCHWRTFWQCDGETLISFIMSSPTLIDKTDTVTVCGDVVFFEVNGVLPNWKTYTFKASFDGPGTKTILVCLLEMSETMKVEKAEEDMSVKFEEEDTMIGGCEYVEIKQEVVELDGKSALHYHAFAFPRLLATQTLTPGTSCLQRCNLGTILSGHSLYRRSQNKWRTGSRVRGGLSSGFFWLA
ncbi:hypothetical protein BD769DRAFT_1387357 [Suillus cothurnatus]|nr:hypothetical protein BD769DRAFT_1387357 [Suillus cothurnatus]